MAAILAWSSPVMMSRILSRLTMRSGRSTTPSRSAASRSLRVWGGGRTSSSRIRMISWMPSTTMPSLAWPKLSRITMSGSTGRSAGSAFSIWDRSSSGSTCSRRQITPTTYGGASGTLVTLGSSMISSTIFRLMPKDSLPRVKVT